MDIEVNYANKKRYKTARYPLHQTKFWTGLIWVLSRTMLIGKKYKVEKINMAELKAPYLMLSNHMHFIDIELAAMGTWPYPVSNVVSIDGYVIKGFLLEAFSDEKVLKILNFMPFLQFFVVMKGRSAYNRKELVKTPRKGMIT